MQDPKEVKGKYLIHSILARRWYWVPLFSLFLSISSILMLLGIYRIAERERSEFAICDAIMDIQNLTSLSHLWFHEAVSGNEAVDIQKVKADMDLALSLAGAILEGGKSEHGLRIDPLRDLNLRKRAEEIKRLVTEFKMIALRGFEDKGISGIGSSLDQEFNAVFKDIQEKGNALELTIEKDWVRAQIRSKRLFMGILLAWISIVSLATFGIWNRESRRKAAEEALQKANDHLQMQTRELMKHEENLEELVKERTAELTASNRSLQQEIIERKEAEKVLQASTDRFRTLVETLPQRVFIKNRDSVYLYCNENYARAMEIRPYEIFGKTDYEFWPSELAERHREEDQRILKSGKAEEVEERYFRHGQEVFVRKIILPIRNEASEATNLLGIVWDITEKIRLESIAEAANLMTNLGYIFSGIRHEIGNPINSIKITLSVLKRRMDSFPAATVHEYIDRAMGEISRMEYLLKTLKNFNMYETPELQNVSMRSFVEKFLDLVAGDFEKEGIKIHSLIQPEAKWGYADPRALQQVLLNILSNAANALGGKDEGEITLRVIKSDKLIKIQVTDNGRGMSSEQQKELFKPFRTSRTGGTGLGLVIAKKLLTGMNGVIEIKSQEGEGTTVNISIPEGRDEHS